MKNFLSGLIALSLIATIIALFVYLLSTINIGSQNSGMQQQKNNETLQSYSQGLVVQHYNKQGDFSYTLKAEKSLQWQESDTIYLINPWFKAPPSDNNRHWYVTAKYALTYPPHGEKIDFFKQVTVTQGTDNYSRLVTPFLTVTPEKKTGYTKSKFQLFRGTNQFNGIGFKFNFNDEYYHINQQVESTYGIKTKNEN